jgi:hypothetical protein
MSSYFQVTSDEPYATCSIEGVKISFGMHLFGESRFGNSFSDDMKSLKLSNTRVLRDCRKGLLAKAIVQTMLLKLQRNSAWKMQAQLILGRESCSHFENLVREMEFFANKEFRRKRLQARWFEADDNCKLYLFRVNPYV